VNRLDTFRAAALSGVLAHDSNRTPAEAAKLAEQHAHALERVAETADLAAAEKLEKDTAPPRAPQAKGARS
jgi:hypothetical protein